MHRETLLEGSDKKLQVCVGITNKHRHFIQHIYNIVDKTGVSQNGYPCINIQNGHQRKLITLLHVQDCKI